jgi:amino acid transporter
MIATEAVKRVVIGRAFASHRLEHTLLPKILALPVFASDALSSVAYATGEILIALTIVTSQPHPYVVPIAIAIALLMSVVVMSYRQTVRAYPSGGGAYIVSKDNLGALPGLVAASALLFDYMMTVVVSIVAGVFAIGSALSWANDHRVVLSIAFVAFVTFANLRGARESGTLFAIPTYGFVVSILLLIAVGLVQCLDGCPSVGVQVEPLHDAATAAGAVGIFAILRAFSQGATALTGVEAISNGVPAFRRPQARNAATTLAVMGTIAVVMFLGISWLATQIDGVVASEERSVPALIAIGVFGADSVGFYVVQVFTAAILILAANTAYQDFPRLASILARDRYMPRQFVNRGDRLVFSNGVVALGILSCVMIYIFEADLNTLIHFYVVGVFTSFTLSQTGMVVHWIRERHKGAAATPGWRRSIAINAVGGFTTAIVLCVVIVSKFRDGAWLSILIIALLVPAFYGINRHYQWTKIQVRRGRVVPRTDARNRVVLLVRDLDVATAEALGYLRAIRPDDLRIVCPATESELAAMRPTWHRFAGDNVPDLEALGNGGLFSGVRRFVLSLETRPEDFIDVVVPEVVREGLLAYVVRHRDLIRLKASLLRLPNIVVTDVPVRATSDTRNADATPLIPNRTVALVFVSALNDATVRAVNYASTLGTGETRAVYFDVDTEQEHRLERGWFDSGLEIPLDIVEAPFRDLTGPMEDEVRRYTRQPGTVVNVVIPELIMPRWWQLPLHNQSALFIKRLFLFEERTILTSVPYKLENRNGSTSEDPAGI